MSIFDFDGDGKTGFTDMLFGFGAFELFNEYCDLKEKQRQNQTEIDRLLGKSKDDTDNNDN